MSKPPLIVSDFSQGIAGPYAARLFAEFGARVIKVEPLSGDWARGLGIKTPSGQSSMFEFYNLGKQGMALDLRDSASQDVAASIIRKSDVLIHNFKVGSEEKFGLSAEAVLAINPDIVLVSINGFGLNGELAAAPATDTTIQAFSGFADAAAPTEEPCRIRIAVADIFTGARAYQVALENVLRKKMGMDYERNNAVSMLEAMGHLMGYKVFDEFILGQKTVNEALPATGIYACSDGYVSVSCASQQHVEKAVSLALTDQTQYDTLDLSDQRSVQPVIARHLAQLTTAEACKQFAATGVPCVQVHSIGEFVQHEQTKAAAVFEWRSIDGLQLPNVMPRNGDSLAPAPMLDQHRDVIVEWVDGDV